MIRYAPTTKTMALVVNSNMLPQGARPAASPRITTPVTLSRKPITVSATPIRPNCSARRAERSAGCGRRLERRRRPAPTPDADQFPGLDRTRQRAARRAEAHSAAWANMASM